MTDDQLLQKAISVGVEAEAFMKSNVGKGLLARAQTEISQAVDGLKVVDPDDKARIVQLQNEIWRAESFICWMAEIVQEGMNAESEIASGEVVD